MTIGVGVQLPEAQNFAENQTKEKVKGMVHVSFVLNVPTNEQSQQRMMK
jgi:hypothetical protein